MGGIMQNIISWVTTHQAMVGGSVVAILDLVFALIPGIQSNGILHFIFVQAQKLAGPQ